MVVVVRVVVVVDWRVVGEENEEKKEKNRQQRGIQALFNCARPRPPLASCG